MGRPKKRQRQEEAEDQAPSQPTFIDPSLSATDAERVCPGPMGAAGIRQQQRKPTVSLDNTPPSDHPRTPPDNEIYHIPYPTDYSIWPDFSETTIPQPIQDGLEITAPSKAAPSSPIVPAIPACPCLPNLYLTLSTLSTLSAFPVSSHTITTLQSAHRTASSVIYCQICPQKFQTGSQNVMLSNTLLTVLVDQWQRVLKQPARDLEKGFSSSPPSAHMSALTELEWKTFAYDLVRSHVFGDRAPTPPPTPNPAPNAIPPPQDQIIHLMSLADAMERRQKQWHGHEETTGEFPNRFAHDYGSGHQAGFTLDDIRQMEKEKEAGKAAPGSEKRDFLCIQLVHHAKHCMKQLDRGPPVLGDCGMSM